MGEIAVRLAAGMNPRRSRRRLGVSENAVYGPVRLLARSNEAELDRLADCFADERARLFVAVLGASGQLDECGLRWRASFRLIRVTSADGGA